MCFSPTASFLASGLLTIIGALCLRTMPSKKYFMIAIIPLMFAVQQAAEGIVWLTIGCSEHEALMNTAIHIFLLFAVTVWPLWIPFTVWMLEKNKHRAQLLLAPLIAGICFISTTKIMMLTHPNAHITADIVNCHIVYSSLDQLSVYFMPLLFLYACAVIAPFFISTIKHIWMFGLLILASLIATYIIWYEFLGSVWCFFAALISMSLWYFLYAQKN